MFSPNRSLRVWLLVTILVLLVTAVGAGEGPKLKPRLADLLNTRVRNVVFPWTMTIAPKPMVDPALDDGPVFSYFARPSYQLGIRGEPFATQVTDNGHLWTGAAEWLVLIGSPLRPLNQRIYTLEKGYLPCVTYTVWNEKVSYTVRAFQFKALGDEKGKPMNFIQVRAENHGDAPAPARFAGGFMYGPRDHRNQQMKQMDFNSGWKYQMTEWAARRDGKTIYVWHMKPDALLARPGLEYSGPFSGVGREEPVGLAFYRKELAPGGSFTAEFVMPHYPSSLESESGLLGLATDFVKARAAFEDYWETWLKPAARFEVGEAKVMNATKSYLIHALMCQNVISDQEVEQHVNRLQYNRFWLRDSSFFVSMYEKYGYPEIGAALCRHFFRFQRPDGNFVSQSGQFDGWGQSMWALGTHVRYNEDYEFALEAAPYAQKAVAWLKNALAHDQWGLMPPTDAFDNEQIAGRYTGHNFWALTGLDSALDVAEIAQSDDLFEEIQKLHDDYHAHFIALLREVAAQNNGIMPPGMDVPGGIDWGNLLPVYPGNILDPFDPLVTKTFDHYRREHMVEGIATYGISMHHYLTERVAQTALVRGEQERAIKDFYAMLLHTGACHEGFEWTVFPWDGRDYCVNLPGPSQTCNFTPHGWYAANLLILYRNMLVREQGAKLHIASALSPEWTQPGKKIVVANAPTRFVSISYTLEFFADGARLTFPLPGWCACSIAEAVIFHVPYYVKMRSATSQGKTLSWSGSDLVLPEECMFGENHEIPCVIEMKWDRLPVEPLSYEETVRQYKAEYRKRWQEGKKSSR